MNAEQPGQNRPNQQQRPGNGQRHADGRWFVPPAPTAPPPPGNNDRTVPGEPLHPPHVPPRQEPGQRPAPIWPGPDQQPQQPNAAPGYPYPVYALPYPVPPVRPTPEPPVAEPGPNRREVVRRRFRWGWPPYENYTVEEERVLTHRDAPGWCLPASIALLAVAIGGAVCVTEGGRIVIFGGGSAGPQPSSGTIPGGTTSENTPGPTACLIGNAVVVNQNPDGTAPGFTVDGGNYGALVDVWHPQDREGPEGAAHLDVVVPAHERVFFNGGAGEYWSFQAACTPGAISQTQNQQLPGDKIVDLSTLEAEDLAQVIGPSASTSPTYSAMHQRIQTRIQERQAKEAPFWRRIFR